MYITHLQTALNNIAKSYFNDDEIWGLKINDRFQIETRHYDRSPDLYERPFQLELYHQFRKLMEEFPNDFQNLELRGELIKRYTRNFENIDVMDNLNVERFLFRTIVDFAHNPNQEDTLLIPDLILHNSNNSLDNQELIVEIKTRFYNNTVTQDLNKLIIYKHLFGFNELAFVCTFSLNDDFRNLLINHSPNLGVGVKENIFIFTRNENNEFESIAWNDIT